MAREKKVHVLQDGTIEHDHAYTNETRFGRCPSINYNSLHYTLFALENISTIKTSLDRVKVDTDAAIFS